jgi:hypothetical protein
VGKPWKFRLRKCPDCGDEASIPLRKEKRCAVTHFAKHHKQVENLYLATESIERRIPFLFDFRMFALFEQQSITRSRLKNLIQRMAAIKCR